MKILVLTSRYTASRDIIGEDFGRQARLFEAIKKLGNQVDFYCADYIKHENKNLKFHGINVMIRPFGFAFFLSFFNNLNKLLRNNNYDVLVATSDPLWGVLAYFSAKKTKIKFLYDLHDNYETYDTYKIPFFGYLDRFVIRRANIITTVSYALREKISAFRKKNVFVIQNGVNLSLFKPLDRVASRKKLRLPRGLKIIGYTGSLQNSLGVDILIRVFGRLKEQEPDMKLLLVGRPSRKKSNQPNINKEGIISFDALEQKDVVLAINSADVVVMPSPSNEFTKYCFPYKCVEYMACNTPIVASALSDVSAMLKNYSGSLCEPGNEDELFLKIKKQIGKGKINYRKTLGDFAWDKIALKFHDIVRDVK